MNIFLHPKMIEVDGEMMRCSCTQIAWLEGKKYAHMRDMDELGSVFWYDPETKKKTKSPFDLKTN